MDTFVFLTKIKNILNDPLLFDHDKKRMIIKLCRNEKVNYP